MYFDYTATTPMDDEIIETYVKIQKEYYWHDNNRILE